MFRIRYPIEEVQFITVNFNQWYLYGRHKGLDFRTICKEYLNGIGTPIHAVARGEWGERGYSKPYGNYVILDHKEGYQTLYGHLLKNTFRNGYKEVRAGDIIGFGGNTGLFTTGPHLHFELRDCGVKIDPMPYIQAGEDLKNRLMQRPLLRVENKGIIKLLTNGGLLELNDRNCWNLVSVNARGINESDYNDLLDLL